MTEPTILKLVKTEVKRLLREELAKDFVYHDLTHTQSVVDYSDQFAKYYKIDAPDQESLAIAAWFHDVGYTKIYTGHEEKSALMARVFLTKLNHPTDRIDQIANIILATAVETQPNNLLEQIIKDADLSNLGESTFFSYSNRLRQEWYLHLEEKYTDEEWLTINRNFLEKHKYFTPIANKLLGERKQRNLETVKTNLSLL